MSLVICANCGVLCEILTFGVCRSCNSFYCMSCLHCIDTDEIHDRCIFCQKTFIPNIEV